MKEFSFLFAILLLMNCGQGDAGSGEIEDTAQKEEAPKGVEEDDLMLRLSMDLVANPQTQAQKDQNDIINYAIDELLDVQRTSSGLYYQILETGQGDSLKWADRIQVHYKGYFLDATQFDSSYRREKPIEFYIGNMIHAWNEGLRLLQVGSKARLLVPSHLGYGEEGLKDGKDQFIVPPDKVLVFELEVLKKL